MDSFETGRRRSARCSAMACVPDHWMAVSLIAILLISLMLVLRPSAARAEGDIDFVCWDLDNGDVECDTFDSFKATCRVIENENELCQIVLENRTATNLAAAPAGKPYFPANTHYTNVKMTRAERAAWLTAKAALTR